MPRSLGGPSPRIAFAATQDPTLALAWERDSVAKRAVTIGGTLSLGLVLSLAYLLTPRFNPTAHLTWQLVVMSFTDFQIVLFGPGCMIIGTFGRAGDRIRARR